jgi:hypothetical protein
MRVGPRDSSVSSDATVSPNKSAFSWIWTFPWQRQESAAQDTGGPGELGITTFVDGRRGPESRFDS